MIFKLPLRNLERVKRDFTMRQLLEIKTLQVNQVNGQYIAIHALSTQISLLTRNALKMKSDAIKLQPLPLNSTKKSERKMSAT